MSFHSHGGGPAPGNVPGICPHFGGRCTNPRVRCQCRSHRFSPEGRTNTRWCGVGSGEEKEGGPRRSSGVLEGRWQTSHASHTAKERQVWIHTAEFRSNGGRSWTTHHTFTRHPVLGLFTLPYGDFPCPSARSAAHVVIAPSATWPSGAGVIIGQTGKGVPEGMLYFEPFLTPLPPLHPHTPTF